MARNGELLARRGLRPICSLDVRGRQWDTTETKRARSKILHSVGYAPCSPNLRGVESQRKTRLKCATFRESRPLAAKRRQRSVVHRFAVAASRLRDPLAQIPWADAHGYVLSPLRGWKRDGVRLAILRRAKVLNSNFLWSMVRDLWDWSGVLLVCSRVGVGPVPTGRPNDDQAPSR